MSALQSTYTKAALPSYARDAEHAAEIAAHIRQLVDQAPAFDPAQARRLRHLLRTEAVPLSTSDAA